MTTVKRRLPVVNLRGESADALQRVVLNMACGVVLCVLKVLYVL